MTKKLEDLLRHYQETLGNVPAAINAMMKYDPITFEGYTMIRKRIMKKPPEGSLPVRIKELIFVLLDCVVGNLEGAKNHVRAAINAGLTMDELIEGLIQVMMVTGISSWGLVGYKVAEFAEEINKNKKRSLK